MISILTDSKSRNAFLLTIETQKPLFWQKKGHIVLVSETLKGFLSFIILVFDKDLCKKLLESNRKHSTSTPQTLWSFQFLFILCIWLRLDRKALAENSEDKCSIWVVYYGKMSLYPGHFIWLKLSTCCRFNKKMLSLMDFFRQNSALLAEFCQFV